MSRRSCRSGSIRASQRRDLMHVRPLPMKAGIQRHNHSVMRCCRRFQPLVPHRQLRRPGVDDRYHVSGAHGACCLGLTCRWIGASPHDRQTDAFPVPVCRIFHVVSKWHANAVFLCAVKAASLPPAGHPVKHLLLQSSDGRSCGSALAGGRRAGGIGEGPVSRSCRCCAPRLGPGRLCRALQRRGMGRSILPR